MPMGRRDGNRFNQTRNRSQLRANREEQAGLVFKAWRKVDVDDADKVVGALANLMREGEILPMKLSCHVNTYIFDPHKMSHREGEGRLSAQQLGRVTADVECSEVLAQPSHEMVVASYEVSENGRLLLGKFESDILLQERAELFRILGKNGVNGFSRNGHRNGRDRVASPDFVVGTFYQPVPRAERKIIADDILYDIVCKQLGSTSIKLGGLEITSPQAH